jgi:hypothetical protein
MRTKVCLGRSEVILPPDPIGAITPAVGQGIFSKIT